MIELFLFHQRRLCLVLHGQKTMRRRKTKKCRQTPTQKRITTPCQGKPRFVRARAQKPSQTTAHAPTNHQLSQFQQVRWSNRPLLAPSPSPSQIGAARGSRNRNWIAPLPPRPFRHSLAVRRAPNRAPKTAGTGSCRVLARCVWASVPYIHRPTTYRPCPPRRAPNGRGGSSGPSAVTVTGPEGGNIDLVGARPGRGAGGPWRCRFSGLVRYKETEAKSPAKNLQSWLGSHRGFGVKIHIPDIHSSCPFRFAQG